MLVGGDWAHPHPEPHCQQKNTWLPRLILWTPLLLRDSALDWPQENLVLDVQNVCGWCDDQGVSESWEWRPSLPKLTKCGCLFKFLWGLQLGYSRWQSANRLLSSSLCVILLKLWHRLMCLWSYLPNCLQQSSSRYTIRTTDCNYPLLSSLKFLSQNTTPLVTHF